MWPWSLPGLAAITLGVIGLLIEALPGSAQATDAIDSNPRASPLELGDAGAGNPPVNVHEHEKPETVALPPDVFSLLVSLAGKSTDQLLRQSAPVVAETADPSTGASTSAPTRADNEKVPTRSTNQVTSADREQPDTSPAVPTETGKNARSPEMIAQVPGAPVVPSPGGEAEGVLQRPKPELEPLGTRVGDFFLLPSLTATSTYDSNIFATQKSPTGDWVFRTRPNLTVNNGKEPGTYAVEFNGYLEDVRYVDHGSLGHDDFGLSLDVAGDFEPAARVTSRTAYIYLHQDPASFQINVATGTLTKLPVETAFTQDLSATHDVGLLGLTMSGGFERDTYENFTINGVTINQTQLNGDIYKIGPKVSYEVSPGIRPYVQGQYSRLEYDDHGFDANEYLLAAGADLELTRLMRGTAFVGYNHVDYDSSTISSQSGFSYGLNLSWYPTELLTVTLSGKQSFEPSLVTTANGTSSIVNTSVVQAETDYEVLRELILIGIASYENDDYSSTTRTDNIVTAGGGFKYLLNRNVTFTGQYKFSERSSISGFNYDRHQVGVGLILAY